MQDVDRRTLIKALAGGSAALALGAGLVPRRARAAQTAAAAKSGLVFHGRGFEPMMSHVLTGESVELISRAGAPLELASAPTAPQKVTRTVAAGGKTSITFAKPGLYLLYDRATTRFDAKVGQVVARKEAPSFPLPAYAAVLVTDRNGRGLTPTTAKINIPDSYMTFEPWAIVVNAGEPVTFTNNDMDTHVAMPAPEPMLMPKGEGNGEALGTGLWLENMESFVPLTLKGGGGHAVITLAQPGLHHYYCPVHAVYSATDYTYAPLKSFGGYPFIMDGVMVVLPS